jgi:hypothetical protein
MIKEAHNLPLRQNKYIFTTIVPIAAPTIDQLEGNPISERIKAIKTKSMTHTISSPSENSFPFFGLS